MPRNLAKFSVSCELLLLLGSGKYEMIARPLPEDAAVVSAWYEGAGRRFTMIVASSDFPEVPQDELIPELEPPVIRRLE